MARTSVFVEKLLEIVALQSYRAAPVFPHEVPSKAICDAIREETGMTEEEINTELDRIKDTHTK
jgi:hypothetical protein